MSPFLSLMITICFGPFGLLLHSFLFFVISLAIAIESIVIYRWLTPVFPELSHGLLLIGLWLMNQLFNVSCVIYFIQKKRKRTPHRFFQNDVAVQPINTVNVQHNEQVDAPSSSSEDPQTETQSIHEIDINDQPNHTHIQAEQQSVEPNEGSHQNETDEWNPDDEGEESNEEPELQPEQIRQINENKKEGGKIGERATANRLIFLPRPRFIINQRYIGSAKLRLYLQFDHVVVMPHGVFHIDSKYWKGTFEFDEHGVFNHDNQKRCGDPAIQCEHHDIVLKNFLMEHGFHVPVVGVICFSRQESVVIGQPKFGHAVHIRNILDWIQAYPLEKTLSYDEIRAIYELLIEQPMSKD